MKFNCYPDIKDVLAGLDRKETLLRTPETPAAILWAIEETERLTGEPIRVEAKQARIVMGKGEYFLPEHPVRNIVVSGLTQELWHVDEPRGTIFAKGFGVPYLIDYEVGYPAGYLPSAHQALILRLARSKMALEELEPEEIDAMVLIIKRLRVKREEDRNELAFGDRASREGQPGKALAS